VVDKNSLLVHSRQEAHPQKINPYLALQTSKNTAIIFSYLHSGQKTIKDKLHPRHSFFVSGGVFWVGPLLKILNSSYAYMEVKNCV